MKLDYNHDQIGLWTLFVRSTEFGGLWARITLFLSYAANLYLIYTTLLFTGDNDGPSLQEEGPLVGALADGRALVVATRVLPTFGRQLSRLALALRRAHSTPLR